MGEKRKTRLSEKVQSSCDWIKINKIKLIAIFVVFLIIIWMGNSFFYKPNIYYISTYPIRMHVLIEDSANKDECRAIVEMFTIIVAEMLDIAQPSITYSYFPDDNISVYDSKTVWNAQGGRRECLSIRTVLDCHADLFISLLKGRGEDKVKGDFTGMSNWQASIAICLDNSTRFYILNALLHEFGHACGLRHNNDSRIMCEKNNISYLPNQKEIDKFQISGSFDDAVKKVIVDNSNISSGALTLLWGNVENIQNETDEIESIVNTFTRLYYDYNISYFYEIEYRDCISYIKSIRYYSRRQSISLRTVSIDVFTDAWTPEELRYLTQDW